MTPQGDDEVARARAMAQHHRRIGAALRYVMDRTKNPEELTPFITGAAATLIEVLQTEDYYTRTLIESALAVAEADAAEVAADSVQLNGRAPLARLQRAADEAVSEIASIGESSDQEKPIESMSEDERTYILALARLADLAGREAYLR
ncbi:MAG: hypothetical protein ACRDKS_18440 [Actinomycetota bacterium]